MNRRFPAIVCVSYVLCATVHSAQVQYYVATDGNDAWGGQRPEPSADKNDGPFRTVERARDAIREYRAHQADPDGFVVSIRGGIHRLAHTLVFGPEDSGTETCPVEYRAYAGERPVLSGGMAITGWHRAKGEKAHLWTARVAEVAEGRLYFNQLFVNDRRRVRARTPNEGFFRAAGRSATYPEPRRMFRFSEGCFAEWDNLDDVVVVAYHSWNASRHWIEDLDLENRIVTLTNRGGTRPFGSFEARQRYYVENYFEALDAPGEWFLKRDGTLYYWPLPGEDMGRSTVMAPVVRGRLIEFRGDIAAGRCVEHVALRGLSIRHVDWSVKRDDWYDHQDFSSVKWAGVYAEGARHCRIEDCEISQLGVHGIYLERGCQANTVSRCHIHDVGGGGVYLGPRDTRPTGNAVVANNLVDNNFLHDTGQVFPGVVGIFVGCVTHNTISHNEVCDNDWSGMSVGWGELEVGANVVESNHIHHVGRQMLGDMAGIYTQGVSPGTVLRNNVIHDVRGYPLGTLAHGIYHDGNSGGYISESNVVYNISGSGFFHGGSGTNNRIVNNIFAFCDAAGLRTSSHNHPSSVIERNIVLNRDTFQMATGKWKQVELDRNVYWKVGLGEGVLRFSGADLATWQELGCDAHSVIADPLFVDAERYDFRLREGSPAHQLGFEDIDTTGVGLYGDEDWVSLPRRVGAGDEQYYTPAAPVLDDGFEESGVGEHPLFLTSIAEQKGTIRVTDEVAASGEKSLRFTDVPGLTAPFYPYAYDLHHRYETGTVEFSFDVMNAKENPGKPRLALRDHFSPRHRSFDEPTLPGYFSGPVIQIERDGTVTAGDRSIATIPLGVWAHVSVGFAVGEGSPDTYTLRVTVLGERGARTQEQLRFPDPRFTVLDGIYLIANDDPADQETVFYVDNVRLVHRPRPSR